MFFLHSPIANAAGHRLTERERGTSEKRNNSSTLRRRCVHSWFADRPFFRFSSHSLASAPRRFDFNHIRLANTDRPSLFFLPPLFFSVPMEQKAAVGGATEMEEEEEKENGWTEKGDEETRGRQSLIFRILAPPFPCEFSFHFARPPGPLFHLRRIVEATLHRRRSFLPAPLQYRFLILRSFVCYFLFAPTRRG